MLDASPMSSAGFGKAPGRVSGSPPARADLGAGATEAVLVPGVGLAVGLPAAAIGGLCADNSTDSGQHTITRITAKTKAVNPSHRTSPPSLDRRGPMSEAASVPIIYLSRLSPPRNAVVSLSLSGSHRRGAALAANPIFDTADLIPNDECRRACRARSRRPRPQADEVLGESDCGTPCHYIMTYRLQRSYVNHYHNQTAPPVPPPVSARSANSGIVGDRSRTPPAQAQKIPATDGDHLAPRCAKRSRRNSSVHRARKPGRGRSYSSDDPERRGTACRSQRLADYRSEPRCRRVSLQLDHHLRQRQAPDHRLTLQL